MKFAKSMTTLGFAAGVALAAFALPTAEAEARVVAYSTLQISNFLVTENGAAINPATVVGRNTSSSSATLTGYAGAVHGITVGALQNANSAASCTGQAAACAAAGQDNYNRHSSVDNASHFSRADSILTGNILTLPGASANSVAEVQLNNVGSGEATSGLTSGAQFQYDFQVVGSGDLTLSFDSFFEIYLFSDEFGSTANGATQWVATLFDITGGGEVPVLITSTPSTSLINNSEELFGPGTNSKTGSEQFDLTVSGLTQNSTYRFSLTHTTTVSATKDVSEPAALGLLGLGLAGLGFAAIRRRKTA